jgi:hypothetical protein
MQNPTLIEAFDLAFDLVIKWVFFSALALLFGGLVVSMILIWKAISRDVEHSYYRGCSQKIEVKIE